jgi:lysophospholipase L1-like esterase
MLPTRAIKSRRREKNLIPTVAKVGSALIGAGSLLLASQALYIALCTPRLPPPDQSGHDFEEDGLVVCYGYYDNEVPTSTTGAPEFKLVLIGDSPVEGIGNDSHCKALGGQTALAFSKLLRTPVRYWSYGMSGLTAKGIEDEMLPLLQRVSAKHEVGAVVVSCGVNNVLIGQSAKAFGNEVSQLLHGIFMHSAHASKIIVMELLDFALMPFIPFPLSQVASWRSKALQVEMEMVVYKYKCNGRFGVDRIGMAYMPLLEDILNDKTHPLLNHIACPTEKNALQLSDFFADDDFHPANHGTIVIGKILALAYEQLITNSRPAA